MSSSPLHPPFPSSPQVERDAFDRTTRKGRPDHVFQASMKSIRSAHFRSNRIRAGLTVSGLFTDMLIYREVIAVFYCVTRDLERQLKQDKMKQEKLCQQLLSLGYQFTDAYEKDLAFLYSKDTWEKEVQGVLDRTPAAARYHEKVMGMTKGTELVGAACVLWGALVIGGGAAAMPRVRSLCGEEATNIFQSVVGPGRENRKQKFVDAWDSLAAPGTSEFDEIVEATRDCMQCNNDVLSSLNRNPWWLNYVIGTFVGVALYLLYFVYGSSLLPSEAVSRDL